jgi:hypothetical protein
MFAQACSEIRNAIYGVLGTSKAAVNRVNCTSATAFMISPGVLATAAHFVHVENDPSKPVHTVFEVIRAPDVGQRMENAQLIAQDSIRDLALLRIENPRSNACVTLEPQRISTGTSCGSLGFPLAQVIFSQTGKMFNLVERFQGASISAFLTSSDPSGRRLSYYETDALMYKGSSGCPGFLQNANVFGMHIRSVVEAPKDPPLPTAAPAQPEIRLAISIWVPSMDIHSFARDNGIRI